jgi:hypothetical protein
MPSDRRQGLRGLRRAKETIEARAAVEAVIDEAARQTMSPLATTTTSYLLLSQCSGFAILTTVRPEVLPCPVRERLSHRFLHRSPVLR